MDINLTNLFLTSMLTYGPVVFGVALFIGALGFPVPGTLMILAAGAFVRQETFDATTVFVCGLIGVTLGDILSYTKGYIAREWVQRRFGNSPTWQQAQIALARRGGLTVFLTRWLLTPLAAPTNLVASSSGYPFWKFLLYDIAGEVVWLLLYGSLGYIVGSQWKAVSQIVSDFSGILVVAALLGIGVYFWLGRSRRVASEQMA